DPQAATGFFRRRMGLRARLVVLGNGRVRGCGRTRRGFRVRYARRRSSRRTLGHWQPSRQRGAAEDRRDRRGSAPLSVETWERAALAVSLEPPLRRLAQAARRDTRSLLA